MTGGISHVKFIKLILNDLRYLVIVLLCILCGCSTTNTINYEYVAFEYVDSKSYAIQDFTGKVSVVQIPSEHDGYPVTAVLDGVFYGYNMQELRMDTIVEIYQEAFENCTYLAKVDLGKIERIGERAFRGCSSLESITIPKTIVRIETEAFFRCSNLETVYFEGSPEYIGNDVFEQNVIIYGPVGSLVEDYAKSNGLEFRSWESDSD